VTTIRKRALSWRATLGLDDFAKGIAFLAADPRPHSMTADRTEFLGRNGSVSAPAALGRIGLSGHIGPALDPCGALMTNIALAPGEIREITFILGPG
jgi:cellobiose phosphorylase